MNDAQTGRKLSIGIALYMILKLIVNGILGGFAAREILLTALFAGLLIAGLHYMNYAGGIWLIAVALFYLPGNLHGIGDGMMLYFLEGLVDIAAGVALIIHPGVRTYFSPKS